MKVLQEMYEDEDFPLICSLIVMAVFGLIVLFGIQLDDKVRSESFLYAKLKDGEVVRIEFFPDHKDTVVVLYGGYGRVPLHQIEKMWIEKD